MVLGLYEQGKKRKQVRETVISGIEAVAKMGGESLPSFDDSSLLSKLVCEEEVRLAQLPSPCLDFADLRPRNLPISLVLNSRFIRISFAQDPGRVRPGKKELIVSTGQTNNQTNHRKGVPHRRQQSKKCKWFSL